jgi:hypothetical protein
VVIRCFMFCIYQERQYGFKGAAAGAGFPHEKWASKKRSIIFQTGLAILREELQITDDESVTAPKTADVETYRMKIEELFEATRTHFIETASNSPHVDFEQYISMLTTDLFVEAPAKKGAKGKNANRPGLAFDGEQVSALLTQWPVQDAVQPLIVFNRKVEEKVSRFRAF